MYGNKQLHFSLLILSFLAALTLSLPGFAHEIANSPEHDLFVYDDIDDTMERRNGYITDVFRVAADGTWYFSPDGRGTWTRLNKSSVPLEQLRFGDFDGDGVTDVFHIGSDGMWYYSSRSRAEWIKLK